MLFFKIVPGNNLREFITDFPKIGNNVEEIIAQKYKYKFLKLVEKCFIDNCFSIEVRVKSDDHEMDLPFQIVFTPIIKDDQECVVCTIIKNSQSLDYLQKLNDYSHLTSHRLRSLTSNISGLFNVTNYAQMKPYDISAINKLLSDINIQARNLDETIKTLCMSLGQNKNKALHPLRQHVVLINPDLRTIKTHQTLIRNQHKEKQIVLFSKPETALLYIKENEPDLVLLDLDKAATDGFKFLQMMDEGGIFTDVIIVSSSVDSIDKSIVTSFPFVKDFISKPLTNEKVKLIFDN